MNNVNIRKHYFLLIILIDTISIWLTSLIALNVAGQIRHFAIIELGEFILYTSFFWGVFIFLSALIGLYRLSFHISFERQLLLGGKVYLYALFMILASLYLIDASAPPRGFTLTFFIILPIILIGGKRILYLINKSLMQKGILVRSVLVYGESDEELKIVNRFNNFPELGYEVRGIIQKNGSLKMDKNIFSGDSIQNYSIAELPNILDRYRIDGVFISSSKEEQNGFENQIPIC